MELADCGIEGVGHTAGNRSRQEGDVGLREEECSWDGCSCHWIQERAQQTRPSVAVGEEGEFRGRLGSREIAAGQVAAAGFQLSSYTRPHPQGTEASGEWGRLSAVCPLSVHLNPQRQLIAEMLMQREVFDG